MSGMPVCRVAHSWGMAVPACWFKLLYWLLRKMGADGKRLVEVIDLVFYLGELLLLLQYTLSIKICCSLTSTQSQQSRMYIFLYCPALSISKVLFLKFSKILKCNICGLWQRPGKRVVFSSLVILEPAVKSFIHLPLCSPRPLSNKTWSLDFLSRTAFLIWQGAMFRCPAPQTGL